MKHENPFETNAPVEAKKTTSQVPTLIEDKNDKNPFAFRFCPNKKLESVTNALPEEKVEAASEVSQAKLENSEESKLSVSTNPHASFGAGCGSGPQSGSQRSPSFEQSQLPARTKPFFPHP